MEKYSTWRDSSSGIAPFVLPVATGDALSLPILIPARLLQILLGSVRFVVLVLLLGIYILLDSVASFSIVISSNFLGSDCILSKLTKVHG